MNVNHPWSQAKSEAEARTIFQREYPALFNHLTWWESGLQKRQDKGRYWWELRACAYYQEFKKPKVIFNRFINSPTFTFDQEGYFHNDACYSVITPSPAITAICNSKIGWWILSQLCTPLQNGYLQVFVQFLEQFPIPIMNNQTESILSDLVMKLTINPQDIDAEIELEKVVSSIFGLTTLESELISEWFKIREDLSSHNTSEVQDDA